MPRRPILSALALGALTLAAGSGGGLLAQEIGLDPDFGAPSRYLDLDVSGRLLAVDAAAGKTDPLGRIDDPLLQSRLFLQGWGLPGGRSSILLLLEPTYERGTYGRLYLQSKEGGRLVPTDLRPDLTSGDFALLPLAGDLVYFQYVEHLSGLRRGVLFDPSRNAARGTFAFPLPPNALTATSPDGRTLYLAQPLETWIRSVDAQSGAGLDPLDVRAALPPAAPGALRFVKALAARHALVSEKSADGGRLRLFLLQLQPLRVVAQSAEMLAFTGRYFLTERGGDAALIGCLVQQVVDGRYRAKGDLRTLEAKDGKILPRSATAYDPARQAAVWDAAKGFLVIPRGSPGYLSLLAVRDAALGEVPHPYTPDSVPELAATIGKVERELRNRRPDGPP